MGNCLSALAPSVVEGVKVFTVSELKKATNDFGKEMAIGVSFGKVVKGYINPKTLSPAKEGVGMAVAVKRFYLTVLTNKQELQEWLVDLLRLNSHPSLVKLIGYGSDFGTLYIVSEYFSNGSFERHICRESRPKSLPWETRLKISIGAAQCLAFLHSRKKSGLYHTYITASEILLDLEFNPKVSYFGLKMLPTPHDEGTHVSSHVNEPKQFHYAPPKYIISGMSHMAGDVYSFGVILLEIITGLGKQRIILAKRAIRNEKENIAEMLDPDLENTYPHEEGMRMCKIIKQCLEEDPKIRPSMQQVLDNLNCFIAHIR